MHASRVNVLALAAIFMAGKLAAALDGVRLPAVFSDVPPRASPAQPILSPAPSVRPSLPLSGEVRRMLLERGLAARAESLPPRPANATSTKLGVTAAEDDAIVMDRVVVKALTERKVTVERFPSAWARAFTTGLIVPPKNPGAPAVYWGLGRVRAPSYGTVSTAPRIELSLRWGW